MKMQVKFKHITVENFCGIKQLDTPLYDRTAIKGQNAVGKSTIRNAIFWVLYNKLSDGSAPDGIRPHDENGVDIDFIDISVTLTLEVEGREIEIKKTQKQNWVKPRGQQEKVLKGNPNTYEINGIEKPEKDFKKYVEEKIALMETLILCTNANAFLSLDTKKKREKLFAMQKDISDTDVAKTDEKFAPLLPMLEDGTITELITAKKKSSKNKEDELNKINVQIDTLEKQKEDIDVAELELGKKSIEDSLQKNRAKQGDSSKQFQEYLTSQDEITNLKFRLHEMERNANSELTGKKRDLQGQIDVGNLNAMRISDDIQRINREIAGYENDAENGEKQRQRLLDKWKEVQAEQFDEKTAVCPTCHRELPQDERERLMSEFEKSKADRITQIEKDGLEVKQDIDNAKSMIPTLQEQKEENLAEKEKSEKEVEGLKKLLSALPEKADISDSEEAKEINRQIAKKEQEMQKCNPVEEIRRSLKNEEQGLQAQLVEIEKQIAKSENNIKLDGQIEDLEKKQTKANQESTDEQRIVDLLEELNRKKVRILNGIINDYFHLLKWQMFKPQINGGFAECCKATIGGTSYDGLLNNGNRILAEIDICMAFQRANDIICPIIVDNTESVDDWLIPEMESQLIMLEHDKRVAELTIEEV